jgi:hypothetical protein
LRATKPIDSDLSEMLELGRGVPARWLLGSYRLWRLQGGSALDLAIVSVRSIAAPIGQAAGHAVYIEVIGKASALS